MVVWYFVFAMGAFALILGAPSAVENPLGYLLAVVAFIACLMIAGSILVGGAVSLIF
jgi:hypothetical protein